MANRLISKPILFAGVGAVGGLLGALLIGELLWAILRPAVLTPTIEVKLAASPQVHVYVSQTNTLPLRVLLAAPQGFAAPSQVIIRAEGLPSGVTAAPVAASLQESGAATELSLVASPAAQPGEYTVRVVAELPDRSSRSLTESRVTVEALPVPLADIMFALDVSGSMQYAINGVAAGIGQFASQLRDAKLDARIGLVAFNHYQDRSRPYLQTLDFQGESLTADFNRFRAQVARLRAGGGGEGESSLDGIVTAADQPWRKQSTRVVILITDELPTQPDGKMQNIAQAIGELDRLKIEQVHLVIRPVHNRIFEPLRGKRSGRNFNLDRLASGQDRFEAILPELGQSIAASARSARPVEIQRADPVAPLSGLQSTQQFAAGSQLRLVIAIAFWSAAVAAGICLALVVGQNWYLGQSLFSLKPLLVGLAGGLLAGLIGGSLGQGLFALADGLGQTVRLLGWTVLGALVGAGLAFVVPNLKRWLGAAGGATGGFLGAGLFMLITLVLLSSLPESIRDLAGRIAGAVVLGALIGLMIAIIEAAFRQAWLEVQLSDTERIVVNLGPEPVKFGSDAQACTIWTKGAAPVAYRYFLRAGEIICQDVQQNQETPVSNGTTQTIGAIRVTVRTSQNTASATATTNLVVPPAARPVPPPISKPTVPPLPVAKPLAMDPAAPLPVAKPTATPVTPKLPPAPLPPVPAPAPSGTGPTVVCRDCGTRSPATVRVCKNCGGLL